MKTNFDKIKAMSSEDFAEFLENISDCCACDTDDGKCPRDCPLLNVAECSKGGIKKWLESEVEDNDRRKNQ